MNNVLDPALIVLELVTRDFNYWRHYRVDMTTTLRIEHPVGSYDSWKKMFDSDPIGRQKAGVRRYRILRPKDDPNYVMIDLEFDGEKEAETMKSALRNLWNSPEAQKVIQNPKLRLVEQVETGEY